MYSKKYQIYNVEELGRYNPIHEEVKDHICYPAYLNIGERGWLLWEDGFKMQKLHTSMIEDVKYKDDEIVITTRNTIYTLRLIEKEK